MAEQKIIAPAAELPVLYDVDVCVIGGGSGGVSTAIAAARNGAKTLLVERLGYLGGTTTAGKVCIWHLSDGRKQVIHGIAQELIDDYLTLDPDSMKIVPGYPDNMGEYTDKSHEFRNEIMKHVLERCAGRAGVELLYYTDVNEILTDNGVIKAAVINTKRGRAAITAKFFVDATGDGDVSFMSGAKWEQGRDGDGLVQGMTMMYELSGIDKSLSSRITMGSAEAKAIESDMRALRDSGKLPNFGPMDFAAYGEGCHPNMNPASGDPTDLYVLTQKTIMTRAHIWDYLRYFRQRIPGFDGAKLAESAAMIGIRESRRIIGRYVFSVDDVMEERRFPDAIGHGFWCIDIHDPKGTGSTTWEQQGSTKFWLKAGHNYQIPFRIMEPLGIENLLVVGRCVSATHQGIASLRLQSHIMAMGQAAGTALAMCTVLGCRISELDIAILQEKLRAQGAYIE